MENTLPTKIVDFKTLPSTEVFGNGIQYHFKSENGYGAFIVRHIGSFGYTQGLWKLTVLGLDGDVCYTTSITDEVLGHLTEEEVNDLLVKIDQLV